MKLNRKLLQQLILAASFFFIYLSMSADSFMYLHFFIRMLLNNLMTKNIA